MSALDQATARRIVSRLNSPPGHFIAVGNTDGPTVWGETPTGPIVFEQHLSDCTLENARARLQCKAMEQCGGGRLAMLDFDLSNGDPAEPHVVVAGFDGVNRDRGPLVWETYIPPGRHGREKALQNAASIERRYGASTVARVVFTDDDGRPLVTLTDAMADYAEGRAAPGSVADVAIRRAFMSCALEALQRIKHGADRDALLRECVDYGRTVGSKVETARWSAMPCTPFNLPGGGRGFICSRTPRPRCVCGQPATLQCDAPSKRRSGTCDKHLCAACAVEVGPDRHLCPAHQAERQGGFKPIEVEKVVVVRNGTQGGNTTVDFVLKDDSGQRFVFMVTGRLLKSIPC